MAIDPLSSSAVSASRPTASTAATSARAGSPVASREERAAAEDRVTLSSAARTPESTRESGTRPVEPGNRSERAQAAARSGGGSREVENGRDEAVRASRVDNFRGFGAGTLSEREDGEGRVRFEFTSAPRDDGSRVQVRGEGDPFARETPVEVRTQRPAVAVAQYRQFE